MSRPFCRRRQAHSGIAQYLAVADAESFDPALLAKGQSNEKSQLDQFRDGEMSMEFFPKSIVGNLGVPCDGAGVSKRHFFAFGELVRIGKVQQLVVLIF